MPYTYTENTICSVAQIALSGLDHIKTDKQTNKKKNSKKGL